MGTINSFVYLKYRFSLFFSQLYRLFLLLLLLLHTHFTLKTLLHKDMSDPTHLISKRAAGRTSVHFTNAPSDKPPANFKPHENRWHCLMVCRITGFN